MSDAVKTMHGDNLRPFVALAAIVQTLRSIEERGRDLRQALERGRPRVAGKRGRTRTQR